jgi:phosphatidylglycerol---prolipoprotein diacylglyceryl transferase
MLTMAYLAMLYLGLTSGIFVSNYFANLAGLDSARIFIATVLLTIPFLVGARLLFVAINWKLYRREPARIWRRSEGGASFQGGLILALIMALPVLAMMKVPFAHFWDVNTFTMLITLIFGRVGCTVNGCCCGRATQGWFALYLPNHRGIWHRRIPTQFLELALAVLILVGAWYGWNYRPFSGAVFIGAMSVYSLGRFVLQPTREIRERLGAADPHRTLAAVLGLLALAAFVFSWLNISVNSTPEVR